jgi:predicted phage terminase large subunit-like protein
MAELRREIFIRTILKNKYLKHKPQVLPDGRSPQTVFLLQTAREVLYGGACAGGKSDAVLMAALQYVEVQGYAAIIFRQSFTDLSEPGALIERSHDWLDDTDARWDGINHTWAFPTGAKVAFGYLQNKGDEKRYKGAEFQAIFFDQVEEILESQYRFLSSRARRLLANKVPVRIWSTANPDGYPWVKQRFLVEGPTNGRVFIPARLSDNMFLDQEDYIKSLDNLDPVHREQLLNGNWDIRRTFMFKPEWFVNGKDRILIEPSQVPKGGPSVRVWDFAATAEGAASDPDYTSGLKATLYQGIMYILDVRRNRWAPHEIEAKVKACADLDGKEVAIHIEEERGAAGKNLIDQYSRNALLGFSVTGQPPSGEKEVRASPLCSAAEKGHVKLVRGTWNTAFLDEAESFPQKGHKDQIDTASYAYNILSGAARKPIAR